MANGGAENWLTAAVIRTRAPLLDVWQCAGGGAVMGRHAPGRTCSPIRSSRLM